MIIFTSNFNTNININKIRNMSAFLYYNVYFKTKENTYVI